MGYPDFRPARTDGLEELQDQVRSWSVANFGTVETYSVEVCALGLVEEVGELCRALIKRANDIRGTRAQWDAEIRKELGDIVIKVCDVAAREGVELAQCVQDRWEDVRQRDWAADRDGGGVGHTFEHTADADLEREALRQDMARDQYERRARAAHIENAPAGHTFAECGGYAEMTAAPCPVTEHAAELLRRSASDIMYGTPEGRA